MAYRGTVTVPDAWAGFDQIMAWPVDDTPSVGVAVRVYPRHDLGAEVYTTARREP